MCLKMFVNTPLSSPKAPKKKHQQGDLACFLKKERMKNQILHHQFVGGSYFN